MIPAARVRAMVLFLMGGCCVAMTGCSNPAKDRLIGKWEASLEMTEDEMAKLMPSDSPIVTGLGKLFLQKLPTLQWEFAADGTATESITFLGATRAVKGSWRFLKGDATTTTIEVTLEGSASREVRLKFADPDTIESALLATKDVQINRAVKFKRVVQTPPS